MTTSARAGAARMQAAEAIAEVVRRRTMRKKGCIRRLCPESHGSVKARCRFPSRPASQSPRKVNPAADFNEPAGRVKVGAYLVLSHCSDYRILHAFTAEVIEDVLDQPAAQPVSAKVGGDGKVGNAAFAGGPVERGGDVVDE